MTTSRLFRFSPKRLASGFTLIELMVAVAIVGILAGIALPAYMNYVTRGKLVGLTNSAAGLRTAMEQFYQDNRQYTSVASGPTSPCADTTNWIKTYNNSYALACPTLTSTTYKITATGSAGSVNGAIYSVDNTNAMSTDSFPTSWGGTANLPATHSCWLMRKGDSC